MRSFYANYGFSQYTKLMLDTERERRQVNFRGILLFALLAISSMLVPIHSLVHGVLLDLRLPVVILGTIYLGLRDGAILAAMTIVARYFVGGDGWVWWAIPALLYGPVGYYLVLKAKTRYYGLLAAAAVGTGMYMLTLAGLSKWLGWFEAISPFISWQNFQTFVLVKLLCTLLAIVVLDGALSKAIALKLQVTDLQIKANTDEMTGLANYRAFQGVLAEMLTDPVNAPVSVMMIDIDHFKNYNDAFGHQAGDAALRKVADAIRNTVRDNDIVGRYGGEEFIVILPRTRSQEAFGVAERIRNSVEESEFHGRRVTISIGIATCSEVCKDKEDVIERADAALYQAKSLGRNCVYTGYACQ